MTTTRACTAIAAAILAVTVAAIIAPGPPAFADPPVKPAAPDKTGKAEKKQLVSDADAKRVSDFFDKLVAIAVANQEDCVKMAAGLHGHIDASQALVNEINDPKNQNKELPPAVKERLEKKVRDELTPAITKKCGTDKGVEAALNRIGTSRAK